MINTHFKILLILICTVYLVFETGCTSKKVEPRKTGFTVVTTLFPLYDFSRIIAGDKAQVSMLLPAGVEPHTFEPKPEDMIRINHAALFVYTSNYMEPWAERIVAGLNNTKRTVVNAGQRITHRTLDHADNEHHHNDHHGNETLDPHFWLDFSLAQSVVDTIVGGFVAADPVNAQEYQHNGRVLKDRLAELDRRYRSGLANCQTRKLLHGGHYTFGYLAARYGLEYSALSGISSDSEPSAERMAQMVRTIKSSHASYLFAEELLSPRLTETLAHEAGVSVLMLHAAHNISRDDQAQEVSFFTLMERNLATLQKGLQCQGK